MVFNGDPNLHKIDKNGKTTRRMDTSFIFWNLQAEPVVFVFERCLYLERPRRRSVLNFYTLTQENNNKHDLEITTRLHYHRKCWKRACLLGQRWAVLYLISIHRSVLCLGLKPNNYWENKTKYSCKQQCGDKKETRLSRHGNWKTRLGPTRPPQNKNGVFTAFGSRDIEEKLISIN